jgi:hypothetical protein
MRVEVDGRDLAELIRQAELPYATAEGHARIAGCYLGLRPWQLSCSLTDHFMGAEGSDLACGPSDKTVLLGCECGEPGCWPLMAHIVVHDREVLWCCFDQPRRQGKWGYNDFDELRFDRSEYEAALADAQATIPDRPATLSE